MSAIVNCIKQRSVQEDIFLKNIHAGFLLIDNDYEVNVWHLYPGIDVLLIINNRMFLCFHVFYFLESSTAGLFYESQRHKHDIRKERVWWRQRSIFEISIHIMILLPSEQQHTQRAFAQLHKRSTGLILFYCVDLQLHTVRKMKCHQITKSSRSWFPPPPRWKQRVTLKYSFWRECFHSGWR